MNTEPLATLPETPVPPLPETSPSPSPGQLDTRLPKRRRRTGKIATLPNAIREQINVLIQDGLAYRAIIEKVARAREVAGQVSVYETRGEFRKAIKHRENEVRLIRRLHELARKMPDPNVALKDYGYADLSDRLDLLATLYHDSGQLDKALALLHESKKLCEKHGVEFDGGDLLEEYLAEARMDGKRHTA